MLVSEGFEERLRAVERRLDLEARLWAAVDGDQAELKEGLRAANRLLQALAKTQGEHTVRLDKQLAVLGAQTAVLGAQTEALTSSNMSLSSVTDRLSEHSRVLVSLDGRVGKVEGWMSGVETRMSGMHGKLDRILAVLERPESGG